MRKPQQTIDELNAVAIQIKTAIEIPNQWSLTPYERLRIAIEVQRNTQMQTAVDYFVQKLEEIGNRDAPAPVRVPKIKVKKR